ncbi:MAG TPA: stage II sporulation protein M [Ignavibacteriaceae bacterium]|nr:stage II sporulation protein M [Ignavibacteriaceae bacterium]
MKEVTFLRKNKDKWKKFDSLLIFREKKSPDELADLFIHITDDLSYSKTFYPESTTTQYLNSLAARVHQTIYRTKKESKGRFKQFWGTELPLLMFKYRKNLLISFIIFCTSILIGIISSANDDNFVRLILGDSYVNMTLENIKEDDPLAVYKKMNQVDMFLGITFNNIRVSFLAFTFGIFFSFGTGLMLFYNGVMLGSFQYLFYQHNLLWESILVVWIHGTLEISAIIIAGCGGLILGNSIIFPRTYSRRVSFMRGAKDGLKIIVGLIPIFILAGFLESFVTRYTDMPLFISLFIIIGSLLFVIWYFIIFPKIIYKRKINAED